MNWADGLSVHLVEGGDTPRQWNVVSGKILFEFNLTFSCLPVAYFFFNPHSSVIRLGNFLKFWVKHFVSKVAQIYSDFWAILKNVPFDIKTDLAIFWAIFEKKGHFQFQDLVTLPHSNPSGCYGVANARWPHLPSQQEVSNVYSLLTVKGSILVRSLH